MPAHLYLIQAIKAGLIVAEQSEPGSRMGKEPGSAMEDCGLVDQQGPGRSDDVDFVFLQRMARFKVTHFHGHVFCVFEGDGFSWAVGGGHVGEKEEGCELSAESVGSWDDQRVVSVVPVEWLVVKNSRNEFDEASKASKAENNQQSTEPEYLPPQLDFIQFQIQPRRVASNICPLFILFIVLA
jgi:hypothetical protein